MADLHASPFHADILRPEIETRSPAAQRDRDRALWQAQIGYLFANSVFYRDKLRAAGIDSAEAAGSLDHLHRLPFTEKDEIRKSQADHPPFGNHLAADPARIARVYSTSGTTGDPVYMPVTAEDLAMWTEISSRSYYAAGLRPGMKVISTFNAGPFVAEIHDQSDNGSFTLILEGEPIVIDAGSANRRQEGSGSSSGLQ